MMTVLSFFTFLSTTTLQQKKSKNNRTKEIPAEVQVKLDRLEEIKEMDKSDLSRSERKELRKEARNKADLKAQRCIIFCR
jgi:hypothetical protein